MKSGRRKLLVVIGLAMSFAVGPGRGDPIGVKAADDHAHGNPL
jgi:hypothetical protein